MTIDAATSPPDAGLQTADEPDPAFGEADDEGLETPGDGEPDADELAYELPEPDSRQAPDEPPT